MTVTTTNRKIRKRKVRFPGIVADARALEVRYEHLWRCLTGRRSSPPLLARYQQLKERQAAAKPLSVQNHVTK